MKENSISIVYPEFTELFEAKRKYVVLTRRQNKRLSDCDDGRDLRSLDDQILDRNTLVWSTLQIVELGVPLTVALGKLDFDVRRVGQDIALLVLAVLESRRKHILLLVVPSPILDDSFVSKGNETRKHRVIV